MLPRSQNTGRSVIEIPIFPQTSRNHRDVDEHLSMSDIMTVSISAYKWNNNAIVLGVSLVRAVKAKKWDEVWLIMHRHPECKKTAKKSTALVDFESHGRTRVDFTKFP